MGGVDFVKDNVGSIETLVGANIFGGGYVAEGNAGVIVGWSCG